MTSQLRFWTVVVTAMVFVQLAMGASMRHSHTGLSIPDFPTAYGKVLPPVDAASIARINEARKATQAPPITVRSYSVAVHSSDLGRLDRRWTCFGRQRRFFEYGTLRAAVRSPQVSGSSCSCAVCAWSLDDLEQQSRRYRDFPCFCWCADFDDRSASQRYLVRHAFSRQGEKSMRQPCGRRLPRRERVC